MKIEGLYLFCWVWLGPEQISKHCSGVTKSGPHLDFLCLFCSGFKGFPGLWGQTLYFSPVLLVHLGFLTQKGSEWFAVDFFHISRAHSLFSVCAPWPEMMDRTVKILGAQGPKGAHSRRPSAVLKKQEVLFHPAQWEHLLQSCFQQC